jgi:serine/threonine-protein kinase HipA
VNRLDYDLTMEIIKFFQLDKITAEKIKEEVMESVIQWAKVATNIGISRSEQQLMASAFNIYY